MAVPDAAGQRIARIEARLDAARDAAEGPWVDDPEALELVARLEAEPDPVAAAELGLRLYRRLQHVGAVSR